MKTNSQRQEDYLSKQLGLIYGVSCVNKQPGSGNQKTAPNDIKVKSTQRRFSMHIEAKETSKNSISVKKEWIDHAVDMALQFGADAVLAIRFTKPNGLNDDYFVVDSSLFFHLLRCEKELTDGIR